MSIEKTIEANTTAITTLTELIARIIQSQAVQAAAQSNAGVEKQQANTESKPAKKPASSEVAPTPAAEIPASTEAKPVVTTSTSLSYDDIKAPFLELAKRDLAAAQSLIAEFGFKTLKDAKPEQYAEILAKLDAIEGA